MPPSNLAVLTKSHNIVAAKKKAKREQIKEIVFDDDARREFLTGFHKRKLQKKEAAKQKAKEREKQERLEARREHRRMLAEQAAKNAEEAERAYGGMVDDESDSEWEGPSGPSTFKGKGKASEEQEEYEGEEQLATVTVVEEFDPDSLIHGEKPAPDTHDAAAEVPEPSPSRPRASSKSTTPSQVKAKAKAKLKTAVKAKDIKYQTNAARKAERMKQRKRKTEKAERAGGKASRRKGPSKGKR
ncbi:hypothetical protein OH77DRAFT_1439482 [Trametes cingulata]|nr:hypothetical protein OH77DRAFT_1439482 [Trametes cingulata]